MDDLLSHTKLHADEDNAVCKICNLNCKWKSHLRRHMLAHTTEQLYKCAFCTSNFKRRRDMVRHVKVRHQDADEQKPELHNHVDGAHLETVTDDIVGTYKTEVESDSATSANDYITSSIDTTPSVDTASQDLNANAVTTENDHRCEICNQTLKSKNRKLRHMKMHTDVEDAMCKICAMSFKWKSRLLLHMKSHSDERNHKCEICGTCFKRRADMLRHIKTQHKERKRERQHKCELCPKIFATKHSMLQHMKLHFRGEMFRCNICLKDFVQRDELRSHVVTTHQDDDTNSQECYKCHVCAASFESRRNMSEHAKSHVQDVNRNGEHRKRKSQFTEGNLYACTLCAKSFKARRYLVQHMNSHNEGQQFKCQICNNNFKTKQCLVTHSKLHMRGKMFRCNLCAKDFIQKIGLQNHLSKMHQNVNDGKLLVPSKDSNVENSTDNRVNEDYNMVFIKEENYEITDKHDKIMNDTSISEDYVEPLLVEVKSEPTEVLNQTLEAKSKNDAEVKEELDKSVMDVCVKKSDQYGWNYF